MPWLPNPTSTAEFRRQIIGKYHQPKPKPFPSPGSLVQGSLKHFVYMMKYGKDSGWKKPPAEFDEVFGITITQFSESESNSEVTHIIKSDTLPATLSGAKYRANLNYREYNDKPGMDRVAFKADPKDSPTQALEDLHQKLTDMKEIEEHSG